MGSLILLFIRQSPRATGLVLVLSIVAALGQASTLFAITEAAQHGPSYSLLLVFCLALGAFILGKSLALTQAVRLAESVGQGLRQRLRDALFKTELRTLEALGSERLDQALTVETTTVSSSLWSGIIALQNLTLITGSLFYIAALEPLVMVILLSLLLLGAYSGHVTAQYQGQYHAQADAMAGRILSLLRQYLEGFKDLKLQAHRVHDLLDNHLWPAQQQFRQERQRLFSMSNESIAAQLAWLYLALGFVVFLLPQYLPFAGLAATIAILLYLIDRFLAIIGMLPLLRRAAVALKRLNTLQQQLRQHRLPQTKPRGSFQQLTLKSVVFDYADGITDGFLLGPIDMTLHPGEVFFIVGGNGSGKSTLLKVLTGLYPVSSGLLMLDGEPVAGHEVRGLFSAVFVDFHLFDRLYGVPQVDPTAVQALLDKLELSHKTRLVADRFEEIRLSTGQRKRLAMIVALLEDRPILLFDEWTADQDPEFRAFFYNDLLPSLKAQGKTVVVVSHDDRYFASADRGLTMERGQVQAQWTNKPS